jgi:hypothetical protein
MSELFNTGVFQKPPKQVLAKVLIEGRKILGKGEDDWDMADTCQVIELLPENHKKPLRGMDAVVFKNWMQRLRKDKVVPKTKEDRDFVGKFEKFLRDFRKNQERRGSNHLSKEYLEYINSQAWKDRAKEHKLLCEFRCQLCDRQNQNLHVHHTKEGYRWLRQEQAHHLLAVCDYPCHAIADMLRSGKLFDDDKVVGFFSEEDIP